MLQYINNEKQIDPKEWGKRGIWQRIREVFALKFTKQY